VLEKFQSYFHLLLIAFFHSSKSMPYSYYTNGIFRTNFSHVLSRIIEFLQRATSKGVNFYFGLKVRKFAGISNALGLLQNFVNIIERIQDAVYAELLTASLNIKVTGFFTPGLIFLFVVEDTFIDVPLRHDFLLSFLPNIYKLIYICVIVISILKRM
jgi:hypothetical protein